MGKALEQVKVSLDCHAGRQSPEEHHEKSDPP